MCKMKKNKNHHEIGSLVSFVGNIGLGIVIAIEEISASEIYFEVKWLDNLYTGPNGSKEPIKHIGLVLISI